MQMKGDTEKGELLFHLCICHFDITMTTFPPLPPLRIWCFRATHVNIFINAMSLLIKLPLL